jgi:hypothetical protein
LDRRLVVYKLIFFISKNRVVSVVSFS